MICIGRRLQLVRGSCSSLARIGNEISNGDPVLNSNGKRLLDFRDDSNLYILNCHRLCVGKFAWFRGNSQSTIDYMLCTNNITDRVKEFIVDDDRQMGLGSDHNVLLLKLSCNSKAKGENNNCTEKFIWDIKKRIKTSHLFTIKKYSI